jgi:hypothetical protein
MTRNILVAFVVVGSLVRSACVCGQESVARQAVESIFSPDRLGDRKTMGLLQRSFLDLVEEAQPKLEVALVIDGTDSMGTDLDGVRAALGKMIEDLLRYKDAVSLQLVIFRDIGAKSGEISLPLKISENAFTNDIKLVQDALQAVQPESGAPFFHELVDVGIHTALQSLKWSTDRQTTRWILVFGDAPPFDESWSDPATKSERRYATDRLVTLARNKAVRVSSVLCVSDAKVRPAYEQSLAKTREFMNRLANETNGLMLDLSYDNIRDAIAKASQRPRVEYQPVSEITKEEIQRVRDEAAKNRLIIAEGQQTRIAILPYMPLDQLSFDSGRAEVQFAAELRFKFRQLPGVSLKTPNQVERAVEPLIQRGLRGKELLLALANKLRVDYVVWGQMQQKGNGFEVVPVVVHREKGDMLTVAPLQTDPRQSSAGLLASRVIRAVTPPETTFLARLDSSESQLLRPVSLNGDASSPLMAAFESLEQALAYPIGSTESNDLLAKAKESLERAIELDGTNAFAHYLLANYHFNHAQALLRDNQRENAATVMKDFRKSLNDAFDNRSENIPAELVTEIKGLHALLVRKDVAGAVEAFESLAAANADTKLNSALRAHWMLAGIYAGDWGVDAKQWSNSTKMREQLIQILAFWEASPEAESIRTSLRWTTESGKSQFNHFPKSNSDLANMVGA